MIEMPQKSPLEALFILAYEGVITLSRISELIGLPLHQIHSLDLMYRISWNDKKGGTEKNLLLSLFKARQEQLSSMGLYLVIGNKSYLPRSPKSESWPGAYLIYLTTDEAEALKQGPHCVYPQIDMG